MGVITALHVSSDKARNGIIEAGIGESIPVFATVEGTETEDHAVTFEIIRDVPNDMITVTSWTQNSITVAGANWPINIHRNKWIDIDVTWTGITRSLIQCTKNTKDTIYFRSTVDLGALGYTGTNPARITNIVRWKHVFPVDGKASVVFDTSISTREQYMGTSKAFGDYIILAHSLEFPDARDEIDLSIVLLSIWQLKESYMAGLPTHYLNPMFPSDPIQWKPIFPTEDTFVKAINHAIALFEERTALYLSPKRVITNPDESEMGEVDISISPLDFESGYQYVFMKLPHHHIIKLLKVEGWYGSQKVIEWNPDWYKETLDKRAGTVQMVPMMGGIPYHNTAMPVFDFISRVGWPEYIAGFWHVDYITGWDERIRPIPEHILNAIAKHAVIILAPVISDAISRGITSSSVSLDGISESQSYATGGTNHLLSARVKQYQDELDAFYLLLSHTEIPLSVETI